MGALGPLAFGKDEAQPLLGYQLSQSHSHSEATAALIDQNIRDLLTEGR
jgi:ATP-dependent Zn protease